MKKALTILQTNLDYAQAKQAEHPSPYWDGRVGALKLAIELIKDNKGSDDGKDKR